VWAHPGPSVWGQDHYGVIRKLHPRRAATRGVLLGRLRSYEHRGSARQTGLRPCVRSRSFSERAAPQLVVVGRPAKQGFAHMKPGSLGCVSTGQARVWVADGTARVVRGPAPGGRGDGPGDQATAPGDQATVRELHNNQDVTPRTQDGRDVTPWTAQRQDVTPRLGASNRCTTEVCLSPHTEVCLVAYAAVWVSPHGGLSGIGRCRVLLRLACNAVIHSNPKCCRWA
jgi:hypothetical protein